jgi:hypothetical protein
MEIRLYRERPSPQRPGKAIVARLWDFLERRQNESGRKRRVAVSER